MRRVEIVLHRVVVGRCSNNHKVSISISLFAIECSSQVKLLLSQILFYIFILYRRNAVVYLLHLFRYHVNGSNLMMLRQQCGNTHSHISRTRYSNFQIFEVSHSIMYYSMCKDINFYQTYWLLFPKIVVISHDI